MATILECANLTKSYGRHEAVKNLSLQLEENTLYGLLGPNGAGKTTLLDMIAGAKLPDYGTVTLSGRVLKNGETPGELSYVREKSRLIGGARVHEILEIAAVFHPYWDWNFANDLLKTFKLDGNKKMRQLSRGMESLVGNIVGLAGRAPLTVYDEPVLGLDVLMRERFYRVLMEDCAAHPRTVLLSTHLIDEIAAVVEQVLIMKEGSLILQDDVDNIRVRSYLVRGANEAISRFVDGKRVIYRESYGSGSIAAIFDAIDEREKRDADRQGLAVDELPLQKLFAYLLEGGEQVG